MTPEHRLRADNEEGPTYTLSLWRWYRGIIGVGLIVLTIFGVIDENRHPGQGGGVFFLYYDWLFVMALVGIVLLAVRSAQRVARRSRLRRS